MEKWKRMCPFYRTVPVLSLEINRSCWVFQMNASIWMNPFSGCWDLQLEKQMKMNTILSGLFRSCVGDSKNRPVSRQRASIMEVTEDLLYESSNVKQQRSKYRKLEMEGIAIFRHIRFTKGNQLYFRNSFYGLSDHLCFLPTLNCLSLET